MAAALVTTVDIEGWADAPSAARGRIAAAVDDACRSIGFLQVTGHGIADATIEAALTASDRFFASPIDDKLNGEQLTVSG